MSIKISIIASWTAHLVVMLTGFLLMPYILKMLGDTTYGTWLFLSSVAAYSGILYLGFGQTISRYTAKYNAVQNWDKLNQTATCILSVYLIMSMLVVLAGLLLAAIAPYVRGWTNQSVVEIQLVFIVLGFNAAIGLAGSAYGGLLIGMQRFDLERGVIMVTTVIRAVITLLFLQKDWGLLILAVAFLTVTIIENCLYYYLAYRNIPQLEINFRKLNTGIYRECFSFNSYNLVSLIAEYLMYRTDTIIIGTMMGPAAVVPYNIASRLSMMIREPVAQIGEIFLPKAGELHANEQHDRLSKLLCKGIGFSFLLTTAVTIGGYYYGDLLIKTWIGDGYPESSMILVFLMLAQVVSLPMQIIRRVLLGMGQVRFPSMALLGAAVINITIALVLIPHYGLWGMVAGMIIPVYLVDLFIILPMACKKIKIGPGDLFSQGILSHTPPLIALFLYCQAMSSFELTPGWGNVLLVTTGGAIVTVLLWAPWEFRHKLWPRINNSNSTEPADNVITQITTPVTEELTCISSKKVSNQLTSVSHKT